MLNSRKSASYVPNIYKDFTEMDKIIEVDDINIDAVEKALTDLTNNQWVVTAGEEGVKEYEDMLGIMPDPSIESVEFRRDRLINRFSSRMPFTLPALKQKLDTIIGAENYTLTIDYNKYIIYLQSSSVNQVWYTETMLTVAGMKPCNMVFINNPLLADGINLSETVYISNVTHNYTLGERFILGMGSFATTESERIIKMASTPSFTNTYLNNVATFAASNIAFVILEGVDGRSAMVYEFAVKSVSDNVVTIEYDVPQSVDTAVTSIELYDANGVMLSSTAVYIPTADSIRLKHTILVKEG